MKLRNKKTGYVANWCIDKEVIRTCDGSIVYNSLADLNKEWEDVEKEPKYFWFIDDEGYTETESEEYEDSLEAMKSIGNYFETKEEAERIVEKLKAWKRLKDMRPDIVLLTNYTNKKFRYGLAFGFTDKEDEDLAEIDRDMKLIFGGEE